MPGVFVFYVSGHGFGHASRTIEVINALAGLAPGARIVIRTSAARWLFDVSLRAPAEIHDVTTDVGVVQRDSLNLDVAATTRAAAAFYADFPARVRDEAAFLRARGATAVVADLPPLAIAAAHDAGCPGIALGNFTWDWIYEAYPELTAGAPGVVPTIKAAYRRASLALRLPMWGGFEDWACPIVDLPFVARRSTRDPAEIRAAFGLPPDRRMVLASFGGLGIADMDLDRVAHMDGYTVVTTGRTLGARDRVPERVRLLDDRDVYQSGFRYEDLVRAADVVVTKPGYGIIAECVANGTALLYTSRGHFAEYDVLVESMPRVLRCRFIDHADLYAGRWIEHLDAVLAQPAPPLQPPTDGAGVAACRILAEAGVPV